MILSTMSNQPTARESLHGTLAQPGSSSRQARASASAAAPAPSAVCAPDRFESSTARPRRSTYTQHHGDTPLACK